MKRQFISKSIFLVLVGLQTSIFAQSIQGELTLNGKSKVQLELETNSVTAIFKELNAKNEVLALQFETNNISTNGYGETIVFFDFVTRVKKNGELIKEVKREQPFPFLEGQVSVTTETFDFIPVLSGIDGNNTKDPERFGTIPEGEYNIELQAVPKGFKGAIHPLEIYFVLRRRPTR